MRLSAEAAMTVPQLHVGVRMGNGGGAGKGWPTAASSQIQ